MSEESSGGGLKNAIIGLVTIIVTAIAGVIGKQLMGGEETAPPPAATAPAPAATRAAAECSRCLSKAPS